MHSPFAVIKCVERVEELFENLFFVFLDLDVAEDCSVHGSNFFSSCSYSS
jgi:hypothetical protein